MTLPVWISVSVVAFGLLAALALWLLLRARNMHIWMAAYVRRRLPRVEGRPVHVMFCFVDHFEPMWKQADLDTQRSRVDRWCTDYRELAGRHRDADGRPPQHSFFYPEEEYLQEHLDKVAALCADGFGEIEIHLHHDNDTEDNFRRCISGFCQTLHERHGALPRDPRTGEIKFAFIHGNWCLDNSRADGRWCGLNNELILLRELGCYADFTLPSAPSDTQTSMINEIYYAEDDPATPKSHDRGIAARVGGKPSGDLLIIPGPLALNWKKRKFGLIPRIENSDVRLSAPPTPDRVDTWVRTGIHVAGRPEWVFVKIHTHGTQEPDMDTLLGEPSERMYSHLEQHYNDGIRHVLHYVSAREMYNIVKAGEAGLEGNPDQFRDYLLPAPPSSWVGGRAGRTAA